MTSESVRLRASIREGVPVEVRTATDEDFADLPASAPQERVAPRHVEPADWQRFSGFVAEIFTAFGMEAGTAATDRSPTGSCVRSTTRPRATRAIRSS